MKKSFNLELNDNFSNEFILFSKIILEISKNPLQQVMLFQLLQKIKDFEKFISSPTKRLTFEKEWVVGELYFMEDFLLKIISEEECIASGKDLDHHMTLFLTIFVLK